MLGDVLSLCVCGVCVKHLLCGTWIAGGRDVDSKTIYMRYLLGCVPLLKLARQESVSSLKHFSFVSISFGGGGCSFFFFPGSHNISLVRDLGDLLSLATFNRDQITFKPQEVMRARLHFLCAIHFAPYLCFLFIPDVSPLSENPSFTQGVCAWSALQELPL